MLRVVGPWKVTAYVLGLVCLLSPQGALRAVPLEADAKPAAANKAAKLRAKLAEPVELDKGIDANTPLKDALEFFASNWDMTIIIDPKAFEMIGVQKVEEQPVQLPKMVGVSRTTALRMLLGQIKGDAYSGTYLIRGDHVLITTTWHATPEVWRDGPPGAGASIPTVEVEFDRRPLDEALKEIADHSGINVVLDPNVGEKARKTVTARLNNTRVDSAVRILAAMADLRSIAIDNVLFVTSAEKAKALRIEEAEAKPEPIPEPKKEAVPEPKKCPE
jgi:hypothetical protein